MISRLRPLACYLLIPFFLLGYGPLHWPVVGRGLRGVWILPHTSPCPQKCVRVRESQRCRVSFAFSFVMLTGRFEIHKSVRKFWIRKILWSIRTLYNVTLMYALCCSSFDFWYSMMLHVMASGGFLFGFMRRVRFLFILCWPFNIGNMFICNVSF